MAHEQVYILSELLFGAKNYVGHRIKYILN